MPLTLALTYGSNVLALCWLNNQPVANDQALATEQSEHRNEPWNTRQVMSRHGPKCGAQSFADGKFQLPRQPPQTATSRLSAQMLCSLATKSAITSSIGVPFCQEQHLEHT